MFSLSGRKAPNNMTYKPAPNQLSFTPPWHLRASLYPRYTLQKTRSDTLAAAPVSITGPGRGVCCWLNPQCETEQLRWIFGCERFLLLFLAARPPSGPREGCTTAHHRHMAEGNLIRLKVTGGQSNLLTCGWFIIPWGDVTLLGPEREKGQRVYCICCFCEQLQKMMFLRFG